MNHGTCHTYDAHRCRCGDCSRAKWEAKRNRYIPSRHRLSGGKRRTPLDVDDIAVERAIMGDRNVPLNGTEMRLVFAWMDAHRYTARAIAIRLGVTERTVQRWRAEARGASPKRAMKAA